MKDSLTSLGLMGIVAVSVFMGCGFIEQMGADMVETMPNPATIGQDPATGGISATQFWTTWGASMALHEVRKMFRWFKTRKENGNGTD